MTKAQEQFIVYFTMAELWQLHEYVTARDEGDDAGWYYGNKQQFEKRHAVIEHKLEECIDKNQVRKIV